MRGRYESKEVCAVLAAGEAAEKREPEEAGEEGRKVNGLEGSSEGGERRPALDVRLRGWRLPALAIVLLFAALFPKVALAASEQVILDDGYVFYQNSDRVDRGFMVMAYNRLNAGALICGYDPNNFTAEQKAKLTQYTSGNNFYQLCESLQTVSESGVPSWASSQYNLFGTIWNINSDFEGMETYYGGFSDNELELAKRDVEKVLNGEELQPPSGGGSGGSAPEGYLSFTANMAYKYYNTNDSSKPIIVSNSGTYYTYKPYWRFDDEQGKYVYYFDDGSDVSKCAELGPTINVLVEDSIVSAVSGNDYGLYIKAARSSGSTSFYIEFQLFKSTGYTFANNEIINTLPYVNTISYSGHTTMQTAYPYSSTNGNYYYDYDGGNTIYIRKRDNVSTISFNNSSGTQSRPNLFCQLLQGGYTGGEPTVPPTNWPDNPTVVTPEPPELPEPRDPVIPDPPSDPVPTDPPTYIMQPTYNVSVFTADLQGILDAMDEHCIHLQNALYTDMNALYNKLASTITEDNQKTRTLISNRFTWLGNVISECLDTLDDNLYDYFHWLAEQFDFESSGGYDDNTVIAWLKKIYAKLGGGSPVNPKPVDPVSDPFGFDDWLNSLWNGFLAFLQSLVGGALSPIGDAIGALTDNFPFCLPWDMMALLALLVAPPVAPNFDLPIYYLTDSGVQSSMQHVDLSPWTPYLGPLQLLFTILFINQLIHLTPKVMGFFRTAGGE